MRVARNAFVILVVAVFGPAAGAARSEAQVCLPTFGYGTIGHSAGFSVSQVGWCGPRWGGWCGPAWGGWCGPGWGGGCRPWGWRRWCAPSVCSPGFGWPAWYGSTWYPSCGSVWMATPFGGSFFSGSVVPYPVIGWPLIAPGFVSSHSVSPAIPVLASTRPRAGAAEARRAVAIRDLRPRGGVTDAAAVARTVNAAARLRAARLVAAGDRHLREAAGDPARLREAVGAYRRAATIASDQPDTFVRQALALVALGDRDAADAALARAVAIDGRLSDMVPRDGIGPADPVFERPAGGPPPLAARGHQILRRIAVQSPPDDPSVSPSVALVAARWAERFGPAAVQVARR